MGGVDLADQQLDSLGCTKKIIQMVWKALYEAGYAVCIG